MKIAPRKINFICLAICMIACICFTSVENFTAAEVDAEYKYIEYFKEYYTPSLYYDGREFYTEYEELYEYYIDKTTSDDCEPDLVLAFCSDGAEFSSGHHIFEDYIIHSSANYPYFLGLHVLTPDNGKIYTLTQAYDAGVEGICDMLGELLVKDFRLSGWGTIKKIGDVDSDKSITVKDATWIQKFIAGLENFKFNGDNEFLYGEYNMRGYEWKSPDCKNPRYIYLSDFDHDGITNIKDATSIQKYVAGIE